jgi:hypothetical protein
MALEIPLPRRDHPVGNVGFASRQRDPRVIVELGHEVPVLSSRPEIDLVLVAKSFSRAFGVAEGRHASLDLRADSLVRTTWMIGSTSGIGAASRVASRSARIYWDRRLINEELGEPWDQPTFVAPDLSDLGVGDGLALGPFPHDHVDHHYGHAHRPDHLLPTPLSHLPNPAPVSHGSTGAALAAGVPHGSP